MNPKKQRTKVDELRDAYKTRHAKDKGQPAKGKADEENLPLDVAIESDEQSGEKLETQIRAAEEEAKKHYDKLLRVMAEFENFKRRIQKEKEDHFQYSNEKLLSDLLPVLDDLDRVLDHVPGEGGAEVKAIAQGVELVRKNMRSALEKYGLKEVPTEGQTFDPSLHEAISTAHDDKLRADEIAAVHRKGYMLNDRLLRASMVTVNK